MTDTGGEWRSVGLRCVTVCWLQCTQHASAYVYRGLTSSVSEVISMHDRPVGDTVNLSLHRTLLSRTAILSSTNDEHRAALSETQ